MLARGGGESTRAKGGGRERVVEDGEVVVAWPTMCAGSGKPGKERSEDAYIRSRPAHPRKGWSYQLHAELRLYLQLSRHETHWLENATCQGTQEHISLCTPKSTISLNYIWKTKVGQLRAHSTSRLWRAWA